MPRSGAMNRSRDQIAKHAEASDKLSLIGKYRLCGEYILAGNVAMPATNVTEERLPQGHEAADLHRTIHI